MHKQRFQALLLVHLFITFALSTGEAQQRCLDLFSLAPAIVHPIDQLTALEAEINTLTEIQQRQYSSNTKMAENIVKMNEAFEEAFSMLGTAAVKTSAYTKTVEFLNKKIAEVKETVSLLEQRKSSFDFKAATENPKILAEERLYEVNSMDPMVQRVSFSKEVLEGVFWTDLVIMQRASNLIFKGIHRGRQHATDKSGIISFDNDRSVYKVKITGESVGAVRVAGFFIGRDFHIVAWLGESSHNANNSQRITEKVNRVRDVFLRTGHY